MPTTDTLLRYEDAWRRFFTILRDACERRLAQGPRDAKGPLLFPIVRDLVDELLKRDVVRSVRDAVADLDNDVADFLLREIEYYNTYYADLDDAADEDNPVGDGEVVKTSMEDLIERLPRRLKKLLKILNELLKLTSGGG